MEKDHSYGRRSILKTMAILAAGAFALPREGQAAPLKSKTLIIYFTKTGNTQKVAQQIQSYVGGDLLELKSTLTYPADHDGTVRQAEKEAKDNIRPKIATQFPAKLQDYDVIFVGYPVWAYTMPMVFYSLFDRFKFSGKNLVPFSTHLGSRLADGPEQIAMLCPQATVLEGLAVRGNKVEESSASVNDWLKKLNLV